MVMVKGDNQGFQTTKIGFSRSFQRIKTYVP
jgi:hypothetical protein